MRREQEFIIPYESYITLGIVAFVIILMVLFKVAFRDNRFLSNSELYIYSQPDLNQRKYDANKKQRKNTILKSASKKAHSTISSLQ